MLIRAGINLFLNEDQTCFRVINPSLILKKVDILTSPVFRQVINSAGRIYLGQETSCSFLEYSEHRRIESLRWIYQNKDPSISWTICRLRLGLSENRCLNLE